MVTTIADDFRRLSDEHNLMYRALVGRMGFSINRVTPIPLANRIYSRSCASFLGRV